MAVEHDPADGLVENDDVRRKALLRLGVAGVVTAAALAGLWWLDQGGDAPGKAVTATPPSPIVSAPLQTSPPPPPTDEAATETPDSAPEEAEAEPATGEAVASGATARTETATPPARQEAPPPPPRVNNAPRLPPVAAPPSLPAPPPARPALSLGEPYLVRAGIFSDPARARELVERLHQQGIRAQMETRVHLGPFANREEAEKAQATLRKLGIKGVLTPAAATQ